MNQTVPKVFTLKVSTGKWAKSAVQIPSVGIGMYKVTGYETVFAVLDAALGAGYRHIDTAAVYRNEVEIGRALAELMPKYGLSRSDLFITSKLHPDDQGAERAAAGLTKTLQNLQTDYLDLYLIHWPGCQRVEASDPLNATLRAESWQVLEDSHLRHGQLKAIGVSNYEIRHLEQMETHCRVVPHVNQIEVHPHWQARELRAYCNEHDIHVTAYSSLGRSVEDNKLLNNPAVSNLASNVCDPSRSVAQLLLQWGLQSGCSVLPKSVTPGRIVENYAIINLPRLSSDVMAKVDGLDKGVKYSWNPDAIV